MLQQCSKGVRNSQGEYVKRIKVEGQNKNKRDNTININEKQAQGDLGDSRVQTKTFPHLSSGSSLKY